MHITESFLEFLRFTLGRITTAQLLVLDQRLRNWCVAQQSSSEPQETNGAPTRYHFARDQGFGQLFTTLERTVSELKTNIAAIL